MHTIYLLSLKLTVNYIFNAQWQNISLKCCFKQRPRFQPITREITTYIIELGQRATYILLEQLDHLLHALVDAGLASEQHALGRVRLLVLLVDTRETCSTTKS